MSKHCPYCFSDQIVQVMNQQVNGSAGTGVAASASFATIGASISKPTFTAHLHCLVELQVL